MKTIFVCLAVLGFFANMQAQSIPAKAVPTTVMMQYTKSHPKATNVKWSQDGKAFQTNFTENGQAKSATYDSAGSLLEDERNITPAALPAAATTYIEDHFKGKKIKDASRTLNGTGIITYEAKVNGIRLIFDVNGKFLKSAKD